jgi:hypothetical protein
MANIHPTRLELIDYAYGWLPPARTAAIAAHLAKCPFCTMDAILKDDYLEMLADTLPQAAVSPAALSTALDTLQRWVATIVTRPTMALAGTHEADMPMIYEVEGVQVALRLVEEEASTSRTLMGLVTGIESTPLYAQLSRPTSAQPLAHVEIDAAGQFYIQNVDIDTYDLLIMAPTHEIYVPSIQM